MKEGAFSVRASDLNKSFGPVKALNGVSASFDAGVMHGIIGPEGSGKTTLMRVMLGLLKIESGDIQYFENGAKIDFADVRAKVAYMPQRQSLYSELSVDEHLEFFKELYGIDRDDYLQRRESLLSVTRLKDFTERPAGKLSGGMYKKLGIMCALLRSPEIMLLDEPTNGVDPISRREFWELLYRLLDQKILIVLTTSYMDEAERCGRVHLLENGKIISSGEPKSLLSEAGTSSFDELFLSRGSRE